MATLSTQALWTACCWVCIKCYMDKKTAIPQHYQVVSKSPSPGLNTLPQEPWVLWWRQSKPRGHPWRKREILEKPVWALWCFGEGNEGESDVCPGGRRGSLGQRHSWILLSQNVDGQEGFNSDWRQTNRLRLWQSVEQTLSLEPRWLLRERKPQSFKPDRDPRGRPALRGEMGNRLPLWNQEAMFNWYPLAKKISNSVSLGISTIS